MSVARVEIKLPNPPSANSLFANRKRDPFAKPTARKLPGRVKTKAYREWIEEAGWKLLMQRPGRIAGRYEIKITAGRDRRDLDNLIKAISDLLVAHFVIEDDSLAERVTLSWGPTGAETVVVVRAVA